MTQRTASPTRQSSNAYNIFILVLTILSLAVMVALLLPSSEQTLTLLRFYDNLICVIFLIDFFLNLKGSPRKSDYFIRQRGWLDLLGSMPALGISRYGGLLRLARLSRLARITLLLRGEQKRRWSRMSLPTAAGTRRSSLSCSR
jgi:voltage-gated potassium channel